MILWEGQRLWGGASLSPRCQLGWQNASVKRLGGGGGEDGQLSETKSWSSREEKRRLRTLVTPARSLHPKTRQSGKTPAQWGLRAWVSCFTSRVTKQYCSSGVLSFKECSFPSV